MRKAIFLAVWLAAVLLAHGAVVCAQERFGAIGGVVKDESGGVLPGVTVILTNDTTARELTLVTDSHGAYHANDLDPGRYTVRFELAGFNRVSFASVLVLLGKDTQLSPLLRVEGVRESVQVMSDAPSIIDLRSTTVAHNVGAEEFDRLPKSRTFQSMAMTAASVNSGEIEGGLQVNGASSAENAFTIDGVVTNSLIHARSRQNAAFEYLQEVQVKTTGIDAEYGGALGGVISAVTKSGGNRRQGEAHYYYQGSALSASAVKRLVLSPIDDRTVSYVRDPEQPDHRNEFGGSLGGPIVRDRLFFFGSVSPQIIRRTNAYSFSNGSTRGEIGQRQTFLQAFGKISYAGRRVNANGSLLYTPNRSTGTLPAYDGTEPGFVVSSIASNASNQTRGFETTAISASTNVDVTLSNRSFVTFRGGYFHDNYRDTGIPATTSVIYQTSNVGMAGVPPSLQGPIGTQNTPRALVVDHDTNERAFANADYNQAFTAGGQHSLRAGVGFQRTTNDANAGYPEGYVFLFWDRTFSFGGKTGRGMYGYYEVQNRGFQGVASSNMTSLYVQDKWTIGERLTLSLGVRTENEKLPTYRPEQRKYGLQFGFADKIAPRLGAAYDLNGDGRLKVYGSWGRYYDWTKYELPRDSFGADFWTIRYRGLDTLDIYSLSLSNMPGDDLWIVPGSYRDQRVPNFDRVDPDIKPTYQDGISAGVEYQIHPTTAFTVHYVHNDLKQVIDDVGSLINGNSVLFIANPGEGSATLMPTSGPTAPFRTPKVMRVYDALELGITRRFAKNWFGTANYTYSRLFGNYGGLASSDEIRTPTTGASFKAHQQQSGSIANPGGSVNNAWNIDQLVWDAHGNLDVTGRLATDRPHVVKLYGAYSFASQTDVGLSFYGGSGTPTSTYVNTTSQAEVFVNGRGDMGRTPLLTQTNLLLSHTLALSAARRLRFELNVINLFNQKTTRHLFNYLNRGGGTARASSAIDLSRTDLSKGYDYDALIRATPDGAGAYDPRYGMGDLFNEGLQGQLMVRFTF